MKKYIIILLTILVVPIIAFADCKSEMEKALTDANTKWGGVFGGGCGTERKESCTKAYYALEEKLNYAYALETLCSSAEGIDDYKAKVTQIITSYNGLAIHPNYSPNSNTQVACVKDFSSKRVYVFGNKNELETMGCTSYDSGPCQSLYNAYRDSIANEYTTYLSHMSSSCDVDGFIKEYTSSLAHFNSLKNTSYDPASDVSSPCLNTANTVISHMNGAKQDIINNNCHTVTTPSAECLNKIELFKKSLSSGYQMFYKDQFQGCADETKILTRLDEYRYFYNNLAYTLANGIEYGKPQRQDFEVHQDPVFCPLGDDVTKDLVGVLRILKIVAPILVLAYTVYETIKSLTKGEFEAESKKLFERFAKRCGAALLLFAIPVLVDAFMQLLNVWDKTGRCVLVDSETSVEVDMFTNGTPSVVAGTIDVSKSSVETSPSQGTPGVDVTIITTNKDKPDVSTISPSKAKPDVSQINTNKTNP